MKRMMRFLIKNEVDEVVDLVELCFKLCFKIYILHIQGGKNR